MNGARGEVAIVIDGTRFVLCLTLGALAEMETLFGCVSMEDLQVRLRRLSAGELINVLEILMRAGGAQPDLAARQSTKVQPGDAAKAVAEAFRAALG